MGYRITTGATSICVLCCLAASPAHAGAWVLPEGQGQAISAVSRTVQPLHSWFDGTAESDENAALLFLEYGAWDDLTVGLTIYTEYSNTDVDFEARIGGHIRQQVWSGQDGDVLSFQIGASFPVEKWFGDALGDVRIDSVTEVDARLLYGRGWQWGLGDSFVSGEGGLRVRGGGLDPQMRIDVTAGHEPTRGILGLLSLFSSVPLGVEDEASLKIAPSLAYTFVPLLGPNDKKPYQPIPPNTIQLGVSWDAADRDSGLEIGLAIWRAF